MFGFIIIKVLEALIILEWIASIHYSCLFVVVLILLSALDFPRYGLIIFFPIIFELIKVIVLILAA